MAVWKQTVAGCGVKINDVDHLPPHCHVDLGSRRVKVNLFSVDSTAIGSKRARSRVMASVGSTGFEWCDVSCFWGSFAQPKRHDRIPTPLLVMGDLANIVRHFRSWPRPSWVASVRTARPYFMAFIRTERDKRVSSLIDDLMRSCDERLTVCSDPIQTDELEWCLHEAFLALEPDSIAHVRHSSTGDPFWFAFGDGLVGSLSLDDLGIADLREELVLESATTGEWGKTLVLTRTDQSLFEIDSASVRAVLDAEFAGRLRESGEAANAAVGVRVRTARKAAGITQTDLGRQTGFDQAVLSRLERGKHDPRTQTLRRIAEALGLSLSALLSGEA